MGWLVLGLVGGVVTTIGGMGGGMLMVLVLSAVTGDPRLAVMVTTPALLVGNVHRVGLFRHAIDWPRALPFVAAAGPGAFVGGALAFAVPPWVLQCAMVVASGGAVARYLGWLDWRVPVGSLAPVGFGIGVVSVSGGAGALAGPVLLSTGLTGAAYLACMSMGGVSMHLGRLVAFGAGGQLDDSVWHAAGLLAVAIMAGNAMGRWARRRIGPRGVSQLEVGTVCAMAGVAGIGMLRVLLS